MDDNLQPLANNQIDDVQGNALAGPVQGQSSQPGDVKNLSNPKDISVPESSLLKSDKNLMQEITTENGVEKDSNKAVETFTQTSENAEEDSESYMDDTTAM